MFRWVTFALLLTMVAGCSPEIGTPEGAYRLYLNSLAHGRLREAFDLLDSASREGIPQIEGNPPVADPFERFVALMGFGESGITPLSPATVEKANPRRKALSGDQADVEVDTPQGSPAVIRMVREGVGWKVHLDLRPR